MNFSGYIDYVWTVEPTPGAFWSDALDFSFLDDETPDQGEREGHTKLSLLFLHIGIIRMKKVHVKGKTEKKSIILFSTVYAMTFYIYSVQKIWKPPNSSDGLSFRKKKK